MVELATFWLELRNKHDTDITRLPLFFILVVFFSINQKSQTTQKWRGRVQQQ